MLGFYPRNIEVYRQALLHKSSSVKSDKGRPINNERLEFLGDAILDAVVADIVYKRFEGKREGFLTNTRSKIVQRDTLNRVAVKIGLDKLIVAAPRQSSHNNYVYGNAFEALVGAIYLDRGYEACMKFMEERIIAPYLNLDKVSRKEVNFKSKLIEWSQKNKFQIAFELIDQTADECQNPIFETLVTVENVSAGHGKGYSKKESQQEAAHETLNLIKNDAKFMDTIFAAKAKRREQEEDSPMETTPDDQPTAGTTATLQEVKQQELKPDATDITAPDEEVEDTAIQRNDDIERIIAEAEEAAFANNDKP